MVLLLALACVLTVNAAPQTMFVNWLASQKGSAKVQAVGDVESTPTCLQEFQYRNCRGLQRSADGKSVTRGYTESKAACCKSLDGDKFSSALNDLFAETDSVGVCSYVEEFFTTPVSYESSDAKKVGQFKVTCELTGDSDKCGGPLADGMALIASGDILRYDNVAFMHGLSEATTPDQSCPNAFVTPGAESKKTAKLQATVEEGDDEEPQFMVGQGDIYAGNFHIVSRRHRAEKAQGKFQRIVSSGPTSEYQLKRSTPPEKSFVSKDGAIALDFI